MNTIDRTLMLQLSISLRIISRKHYYDLLFWQLLATISLLLILLLPYTADVTKITFINSNIIPIKCPWFSKLDKYNNASTVGGFYMHKHKETATNIQYQLSFFVK